MWPKNIMETRRGRHLANHGFVKRVDALGLEAGSMQAPPNGSLQTSAARALGFCRIASRGQTRYPIADGFPAAGEGCDVGVMARGAVQVLRAMVGAAVLTIALITIIAARSGVFPNRVGQDPSTLTADQLKEAAADELEVATGPLGSGYAFDIVQTSTMKAKPGGPLIPIPNPENGREIIGEADEYPYYTLLERGVQRPEGFWSELRSWPVSAGEPDFDKAELRRSALVRDKVGWRNDREGWYQSDVLPGVGLDPATASLLPTLLRDSEGAIKRDDLAIDGATLLRVDATADKGDIPGLVAADGEPYTKLTAPVEFGFDALGRLVRIHAVALNTNLEEFDLVVDTVISIRYDGVGDLPQPAPTWVPAPAPTEAGR
jgi:hypothetical protein